MLAWLEWFAWKSLVGNLWLSVSSMVCSRVEPLLCLDKLFLPRILCFTFPALCFAGLDLDISPRWGMQLRAVGENPIAADAMVYLWEECKPWRLCWVVFWLLRRSLYLSVYMPTWMEGIIGGRGWIVIALTILRDGILLKRLGFVSLWRYLCVAISFATFWFPPQFVDDASLSFHYWSLDYWLKTSSYLQKRSSRAFRGDFYQGELVLSFRAFSDKRV